MAVRQQVTGLAEWRRTLRTTEGALGDWKDVNSRVAKFGAGVVARAAPVRTGALAASVKGTTTRYAAVITAGSRQVPYAAPIHWGWPRRHIAANPFVTVTIGRYAGTIREMYQRRVDQVVDKARRGP